MTPKQSGPSIWRFLVALVVTALTMGGVMTFGASAASAHTPSVSASCSKSNGTTVSVTTTPYVLEPKVDCAAKTITFHVDVPAGTTNEVDLDFLISRNGEQVFGGFWGTDKSGDMVINLAALTTSTDGTYTYKVLNDNTGAEVKTGSFTLSCSVSLPKKVTAVNGVFTDVCGPDFNLKFTPAVTEGVKYTVTRTGNTVKVTAEALKGYELANPEWSQTATDQLVACPVVPKKVTAVNGVFTDVCGPDFNLSFTPAVTEGVKYVQTRTGNTVKVTAEALKGYELANPEWSQTATDQLVACPVVPAKPPVTNQCSNGTNPGDVNMDGKKDAKDCVKKPVVKADKPIVNAGVDTVASPVHGGSGFNGTAAGIAAAAVLLAASVVEVLRRRRTAPVNNR